MSSSRLVSAGLTTAAVVALLVAAAGTHVTIAAGVALAVLLGIAVRLRRRFASEGTSAMGAYAPARLLVAATLLLCLSSTGRDGWSGLATVLAAMSALATSFEPQAAQVWRRGSRFVRNVPGLEAEMAPARRGSLIVLGNLTILAACALSVWLPVVGTVLALVLALALTVVAGVWTRTSLASARNLDERVHDALARLGPALMVYLTGPGGTQYQLGVWLAQLEALAEPPVIVVRETPLARRVAEMTGLPVVAAPTLANLEAVHAPTFRVCLYVNNGAKNSHNIRYRELTHVQLLHGDSDKPSSFNPVTAMFDKIFVAGEAGADRYAAHGVDIPREKFEIIGRPQVADITTAGSGNDDFTVLYAPTWSGFNSDNNFGSLEHGEDIVRLLLARSWRVIFRPHPFSLRDPVSVGRIDAVAALLRDDSSATGRRHVGPEAQGELSLVECFNGSDALVSDVSSVAADYLYSEKPFVITQVTDQEPQDFLAEFPLAGAAYVARTSDPQSLRTAIDQLSHDVRRDVRLSMRTYYLGDIPRETYAEAFPRAVAALLEANPRYALEETRPLGDILDVEDDAQA
ncbi:CDP-glycerol glycerophosphotransferase family protein [Cellulomonas sp. PhB143]|uniref:CDP-glycerol glycerophosphotransferase family protein n=1 Tax=Cellulomonas sp. PhB143 TaxID=2485186 RepID=UPI000F47A92A|nr:CDP-glycerol glycerophosphotransferase family protein [Cellulomonas sp. PhB143]ROS78555.1 CDP-glycerol:poly(glycerophosphate) glycerophosphotransferase [Cellulomonas sp. PhB143]